MIPPYDTLMLPVLRHCAEQTWLMRDLITRIAEDLSLSQEERDIRTPSGMSTVIATRVHWAKTYLKQAGLLCQPKHGVVVISDRGRELLGTNPEKIDVKLLEQFEEFRAFQRRTRTDASSASDGGTTPAAPSVVPEEQIAAATKILDEALRDALLNRVLAGSPAFFEKLIIDLLKNMGYGGGREDAGKQLGQAGDGGVDGVIDEDRLGLDRIYLQAKRYQPDNKVGSPAIFGFIGALVGKGAHKGVFITTSSFTEAAKDAAKQSGSSRVVLIDGDELTSLMVRFEVGVRLAQEIEIKRIDMDYFEATETE